MRGAGVLAVLLAGCSFVESVDDYAGEPKDAGQEQDATFDAGDGSPWPGCGLGQKSCDDKCVSANDPAWGCSGTACKPCAVPRASATCVAGVCGIKECEPGWADCDKNADNGCEIPLGTSQNCASCGDACASNSACTAGACKVTSCPANFADCDTLAANGCEADLGTTGSCGACGTKCKPGFICTFNDTAGWLCACPNQNACGNGGDCFYGICICSGTNCGVGQSCTTPNTCG